jgi:hypothetical protein
MLMPVMRPRRRSGVSSWRMMLRMMVLTESEAPTTARQANVVQKVRDRPKTTVANPYAATAARSIGPRRSIRSAIGTIAALAAIAPTAGAAYSQP